MFRQVLSLLKERPLRLSELAKALALPPRMAANLVIQLEDGGMIEPVEETIEGTGCQGCGASACIQGNCHCGGRAVDPPYRLTEQGEEYLKKG